MRVVIALGGNALAPLSSGATYEEQRIAAEHTALAVAHVAEQHQVVVTYGSGPQVGDLASALARAGSDRPLDAVDAQTAGMLGHLLELGLENHLPEMRPVVTVLTQSEVALDDPAFDRPTKFVGREYDVQEAQRLGAQFGWSFARDGGRLRRVVPSPVPIGVRPVAAVRRMLDDGAVVLCGGGGGIPIARTAAGRFVGVEAVVDKDSVSALIAEAVGADLLVIATDVAGVFENWGHVDARLLSTIDVDAVAVGDYPAGSMRPKVEAAAHFARGGGVAVVGALHDLEHLVAGQRGTRFVTATGSTSNVGSATRVGS